MSITYKPKHPFYNFKPSGDEPNQEENAEGKCGKQGYNSELGLGKGYDNAIPCMDEYNIVKKLVNFHTKENQNLLKLEVDQTGKIKNIIYKFFQTNTQGRLYSIKEKITEQAKAYISVRRGWSGIESNTISKNDAKVIGKIACWMWLNNYYAPADGYWYQKYEP